MDGQTDEQTDRCMDGQNIPCILEDIVLLGPRPENLKKKKKAEQRYF